VGQPLTDRELTMILAALRHWQMEKDLKLGWCPGWFGGGLDQKPMNTDEINELCEKVNQREFEEEK
jgi:hypothetical protein